MRHAKPSSTGRSPTPDLRHANGPVRALPRDVAGFGVARTAGDGETGAQLRAGTVSDIAIDGLANPIGRRVPGRKRHAAKPSSSGGGRKRRNEVELEVGNEVLGDEVVRNLVDHWIAPMVVDRISENMLGAGAISAGVFQEYNKAMEDAPDGTSEERKRTPAETRSAQAYTETSTVAHPGGAQGAEQVRGTAEYDRERSDTRGRSIPVGTRRR
jgi:hypothetical protein